MLFFLIPAYRAAWGLKKDCTGQIWALCPHFSGSSIKLWGSQKGFTGNKQRSGPLHLSSPPWHSFPHRTTHQNLCARHWLFWYCWLVTGSKDIFHHVTIEAVGKVLLTLPEASTFLTPSTDRAQGTMWFRITHVTKSWEFSFGRIFVHWRWESLNLVLAHEGEISNVSLSSQFHSQRWGETAILKTTHPTCLTEVS